MKAARAQEIIKNVLPFGELKFAFKKAHSCSRAPIWAEGITKDEDTYIRKVWSKMAGNTSYYSALLKIAKED